MVKLSIIIPVWNTGDSAVRLIDSLLTQYDDMEIIVIDDGSTDDSLARLEKVARRDKRVRLIHQENKGQSVARNAGINISRGEYLIFLDSDDEVAADYVKSMLRPMEKNPQAVMAVCGIEYHRLYDESREQVYISRLRGRKNREKMADYVLYLLCRDGRMYSSVNKIFRAQTIREARVRFEPGRKFAEDTKFVLDYLLASNYSSGDIIFINRALYIYNYGTETSTIKDAATVWQNWERQYRDSLEWAKAMSGGKLGPKTWLLLRLLRLRWRISYARARRRKKAADKEKHAGKFVVVGIAVTLFDFLVCTLLTRIIFHDNGKQEISAALATALATVVAYVLHSKITWRERKPGKRGILMFFLWNALMAFAIRPGVTWAFGLLTGLYQLAFSVSDGLGLPFGYDTVEYLGVYALTTVVVMALNFIFYDKLVFGKKK